MMDKASDAFRTISEVAEELGLPQHVLRFWETRFAHIKPLKRGGGRRYYRPDDVDFLRGIRYLLYGQGYTIKGVQRIIKERGMKAVTAISQEPGTDPAGASNPPQKSEFPSSGLSSTLPSVQEPDEIDAIEASPSAELTANLRPGAEPGLAQQSRVYTPRADVSIMRGGLSGLRPAASSSAASASRNFKPLSRANLNLSGDATPLAPGAPLPAIHGRNLELSAAEVAGLMSALQDLAECRRILEAAGRS